MKSLELQLREIEKQIEALKELGHLPGYTLVRTASGGNATGLGRQPGRYLKLRPWGKQGGRGSVTSIPMEQIPHYEQLWQRSKEIRELERQRASIVKQIDREAVKAAKTVKRSAKNLGKKSND